MYRLRIYLKVVRMFNVGFEVGLGFLAFLIRIMVLHKFCALNHTLGRINGKTNEIANVCGISNPFAFVILVVVLMDNMIAILLIC